MSITKGKNESDIVREVGETLQKHGVFFWRTNNIPVFGKNNAGKMTFRAMPRFSRKGVPDYICLVNGKFIGLEVKAPNGKMRSEQDIFMRETFANGGHFAIVRSSEDALNAVRPYLYRGN
jgi:hypothetical protein